MSKPKKPKAKSASSKPTSDDLGESGEYHLPIEPKPIIRDVAGASTRRLLILLSLGLGAGAALLVWWLGTNL